MKNNTANAIKILNDYKTYIKNTAYVDSFSSSQEGSYSFARTEVAHETRKAKRQEFEIALMKEIILNPEILEKTPELDIVKEIVDNKLNNCYALLCQASLSKQQAYDQANAVLARHMKNVKHFFEIDKMASMGYSEEHPEIVAESHSVAKKLAQQDCVIELMTLMANNPEILTIQDVNGNNLGMECARLKLTICAEIAKENAEASLQRNELGYTIEDTMELVKPKAFRRADLREIDFER